MKKKQQLDYLTKHRAKFCFPNDLRPAFLTSFFLLGS